MAQSARLSDLFSVTGFFGGKLYTFELRNRNATCYLCVYSPRPFAPPSRSPPPLTAYLLEHPRSFPLKRGEAFHGLPSVYPSCCQTSTFTHNSSYSNYLDCALVTISVESASPHPSDRINHDASGRHSPPTGSQWQLEKHSRKLRKPSRRSPKGYKRSKAFMRRSAKPRIPRSGTSSKTTLSARSRSSKGSVIRSNHGPLEMKSRTKLHSWSSGRPLKWCVWGS